MTDVEKAVFVAVYAWQWGQTDREEAIDCACSAVVDLRMAKPPDTSFKVIVDEVRGVVERRCPVCDKIVTEPHFNWASAYCSRACLIRGS